MRQSNASAGASPVAMNMPRKSLKMNSANPLPPGRGAKQNEDAHDNLLAVDHEVVGETHFRVEGVEDAIDDRVPRGP